MRKLTELLQEIPLDEMMGGLNGMKNTAENKTVEQSAANAHIKSKAPAAVAIAACAVVAVVGAVQLSHNSFEPGAADDNPAVTTDAEDAAENDGDNNAEDTDAWSDEGQTNYLFSRLLFDNYGRDYDLAKDNIRLMDDTVDESVTGFKSFDIHVADVHVSYPYYDIEIAVQTKDGSKISDKRTIEFTGGVMCDGISVNHSSGGMDVYGDKATGTLRINMTDETTELLTENSDITVSVTQLRETDDEIIGNGSFQANFKAGEIYDKDKLASGKYMLELPQEELFFWNMEHYAQQRDLEFYVNGLSWTNCGLTMNIDVQKGDAGIEDYELGWDIDSTWRIALIYVPKEELEGEYADTIYGKQYFDPDRDYNFVKIEYKDGTIKNLDYNELTCKLNEDGSYTLYFKNLYNPYDSENVGAFLIGNGRVELP